MKAKEYYKKYGERLMDPKESSAALIELFKDFAWEYKEITERRKVSSSKSILAVLDELNDKWNALAAMFPFEVLKRNGYKDWWLDRLGLSADTAKEIRNRRGL